HGWTAEQFLDELHQRLGFRLDPAVEEHPPDDVYRDHVGIHAQKQPGLSYVGAVVLRGRITADQMQSAADVAERYASGELRATTMQNLLVVNVPTINADALAKELDAIGFQVRDRKSTRLNSSHRTISYAVFCLKKKKKKTLI